MKKTTITTTIAAMLLGASGLHAQEANTAYTNPSGFVTVEIAPAPSEGQAKLTGFSVALREPVIQSGNSTSITSSTLSKTGAGWALDEWVTQPHLLHITNADGAEEAFLITSHTSDTLTVSVTFDLTSRYGNGAAENARSYTITKAHTFGDLFGTEAVPFLTGNQATADLLYVWNGGWTTYYHNGSNWKKSGSFANVNTDVVYPDEGLFVLRRGITELDLVFTGSVPTKPQVSTIPGESLTVVASRYPVGTTVSQLGFQNLDGWQSGSSSSGDRFYLWSGGWVTYYYNGSNWKKSGSFANVNDEVVPGNALIFVQRVSSSAGESSANTHAIPYNLSN